MHRVFTPWRGPPAFRELTVHDLCHTGAPLMIAEGCRVKVIAERGRSDGGGLVLKRHGNPMRAPQ